MKTKKQIAEKFEELKTDNEMNESKDTNWDRDLANDLQGKMEILEWVLE